MDVIKQFIKEYRVPRYGVYIGENYTTLVLATNSLTKAKEIATAIVLGCESPERFADVYEKGVELPVWSVGVASSLLESCS